MEDIRVYLDKESGTWNVAILLNNAWECVSTNCTEDEARYVEELLCDWRAESA